MYLISNRWNLNINAPINAHCRFNYYSGEDDIVLPGVIVKSNEIAFEPINDDRFLYDVKNAQQMNVRLPNIEEDTLTLAGSLKAITKMINQQRTF